MQPVTLSSEHKASRYEQSHKVTPEVSTFASEYFQSIYQDYFLCYYVICYKYGQRPYAQSLPNIPAHTKELESPEI